MKYIMRLRIVNDTYIVSRVSSVPKKIQEIQNIIFDNL